MPINKHTSEPLVGESLLAGYGRQLWAHEVRYGEYCIKPVWDRIAEWHTTYLLFISFHWAYAHSRPSIKPVA